MYIKLGDVTGLWFLVGRQNKNVKRLQPLFVFLYFFFKLSSSVVFSKDGASIERTDTKLIRKCLHIRPEIRQYACSLIDDHRWTNQRQVFPFSCMSQWCLQHQRSTSILSRRSQWCPHSLASKRAQSGHPHKGVPPAAWSEGGFSEQLAPRGAADQGRTV